MILETNNLTKMYGHKAACSNICLSVEEGQIFGFLGPNGAGKSTLVKMLVGLLFPTSGMASILNRPLGDLRARAKIGYLPENFYYQEWLTGEELLSFHGSLYGMSRADRRRQIPLALERVGLSGKKKQKVGAYSKGMRQRAGLACALLHDPDLIFLDEPTSALDPLGRREVREIMLGLRDSGKTIFLNSHLLSEVEMVCDRVAFINQGKIVASGTLEELAAQTIEVEMQVEGMTQAALLELSALSSKLDVSGRFIRVTLQDREQIPALAEAVVRNGGRLFSLNAGQNSLEELFVDLMQSGD